MERSHVTVEELSRLVPSLEELEELRLWIAGVAVPDPGKEWDGSRVSATVDKRVVSLPQVEDVIGEAEEALHRYITSLFSSFRPLFRTFWAGDDVDAARHLIAMGEQQEEFGRFRKARQCYEAALALSLPLAAKEPQIVALRRIARVERAVGDLQEALLYYRRSAELARHAEATREEVIALTGSGNVLALQGKWGEAETCYRSALGRIENGENGRGGEPLALERAQLYNNLGLVATRQRRFAEAEDWLARAAERWATLSSPADLAVCYHVQGTLRQLQDRREAARNLFQSALELAIPPVMRALIAIDLAQCYLADGIISEAERYGREAEQHAIAAHSPYALGETYRGLGNIARVQGNADGITFFEKVLEIAREKRYPLLEGETLVDYALLRLQLDGQEEAQAYLQRAREIFLELGAVHEQARAEQVLQEIATLPSNRAAAD